MDIEDVSDGLVAHVNSSDRGQFVPSGGAVVTNETAVDLWRRMTRLPDGDEMRCHLPRYGLALGHSGGYHWFATICWQCNNIYITCDGAASRQTFDGESAEARGLLSDIRAILGDSDTDLKV